MENQLLINQNKHQTHTHTNTKYIFSFFIIILLLTQILILIYIYRLKTYAENLYSEFKFIHSDKNIEYINQIKLIINYICQNIINCTNQIT